MYPHFFDVSCLLQKKNLVRISMFIFIILIHFSRFSFSLFWLSSCFLSFYVPSVCSLSLSVLYSFFTFFLARPFFFQKNSFSFHFHFFKTFVFPFGLFFLIFSKLSVKHLWFFFSFFVSSFFASFESCSIGKNTSFLVSKISFSNFPKLFLWKFPVVFCKNIKIIFQHFAIYIFLNAEKRFVFTFVLKAHIWRDARLWMWMCSQFWWISLYCVPLGWRYRCKILVRCLPDSAAWYRSPLATCVACQWSLVASTFNLFSGHVSEILIFYLFLAHDGYG